MTFDEIMAMGIDDFRCPRCGADAGSGCLTPKGDAATEPHKARVDLYWDTAAAAAKAEGKL